jgi:uncharacterized phosphosugar-binding protein
MSAPAAPALPWLAAAQALLARLAATQGPAIEEAARWCADAIAADGLVHLVTLDGLDTPVGPGSTITAVAIVNSLKVRIAELLVDRGAMPPVITRASVVGPERSQALFDGAYREHARRVARAIEQQGGA